MTSKLSSPDKFRMSKKGWNEESRLSFDFDGDGKTDALIIAERVFEDGDSEDKRENSFSHRFLIGVLSNKGTPRAVLPAGAGFPMQGFPLLVDTHSELKPKGVAQISWSTMASMGTWSTSHETQKWRYEKGNFRLIGLTNGWGWRNRVDTSVTDENLLTGDKIVTTEKEDPETEKVKTKTEKSKGKPRVAMLTDHGSCENLD